MAAKKVLSWNVVLEDIAKPAGFKTLLTVVADNAGDAEKRALEIQGPVNNGTGYVYKLQAVDVRLKAIAEGK